MRANRGWSHVVLARLRRVLSTIGLAVVTLLPASCGDESITEVVIEVDAEPGSLARGFFLAVEVTNGEGTVVREPGNLLALQGDGANVSFPVRFGLIPDQSQRFTFDAQLLDEQRGAFNRVVYEGQYTEGEVQTVRLTFEDRRAVVSAGPGHTCATRDGRTWCFGDNRGGQVGVDPTNDQSVLMPSPVEGTWASVHAGGAASCAIGLDRKLTCWGSMDDAFDSHMGTEPFSGDIEAVGLSWGVICAITVDGLLQCLGDDTWGVLGNDPLDPNAPPIPVPAATVSVAGIHACGTDAEGALYCWGSDGQGQLGNGPEQDGRAPTRVGGRLYRQVDVGGGSDATRGLSSFGSSCAVDVEGALYCWGYNGWGMLADVSAPFESVDIPTRVGTRSDWSQVSVGGGHTCGVHDDGALECWGHNGRGQLGVGRDDREDRSEPTPVDSTARWASVSCGSSHTCATSEDGAVYCWGLTDSGRLGAIFGGGGIREVGQPVEVQLDP